MSKIMDIFSFQLDLMDNIKHKPGKSKTNSEPMSLSLNIMYPKIYSFDT
jgi:hypothetical protein